jgi:hypothetical protein
LAINKLTTDLELKVIKESMAKISRHYERCRIAESVWGILNPEVLKKISVTGNGNAYAVTGVGLAIDGLENRLSGEVSVATVN